MLGPHTTRSLRLHATISNRGPAMAIIHKYTCTVPMLKYICTEPILGSLPESRVVDGYKNRLQYQSCQLLSAHYGTCFNNTSKHSGPPHKLTVDVQTSRGIGTVHKGPLHQKVKLKENQIVESKDKPFSELTTGQKVARAGQDASYLGIIVLGVGVTGAIFYVIGRELFSGNSPNGVYTRALKLCRKKDELTCAIGEPLKGFGELTRRGRRRYTSHLEYEKEGVKHMRMKFYVQGPDGRGTVQLEAKKNDRGRYEFRYIFVELDDSFRTFIIEDNR